MKKIFLPILILFIQCSTSSDNQLTQEERDFARSELENSRDNLLNTIANLNEVQLHYKVDASSWSIAECTEHITLFENIIIEALKESLELPANPERRKDLRFTDQELMAHVTNRTEKKKTTEDFEPIGTYGSHNATVEEFKVKRQKQIEYVKSSKDDFRNHFANFGVIDAYQAFLYLSSHTNRHVQQIEEIINTKEFPNK